MGFQFMQKSMTFNNLERSKLLYLGNDVRYSLGHNSSPVTKSNMLPAQRSAYVSFTNLFV